MSSRPVIIHPALLYIITFFIAACSLIYELLIAQTISFFASNLVIWYSLTIGLYLVAMGAGAFLYERHFSKKDPWLFLGVTEIILGIVGGLVVIFIYVAQMLMGFAWVNALPFWGTILFWIMSLSCILSVGILTGLELPVLIRMGEMFFKKDITNRILSADYFGSLAGGLIFPLVLFPRLELMTIGFVVASFNLAMAFMILKQVQRSQKLILLTGIFLVLFMIGSVQASSLTQYFAQKYYYYEYSGGNIFSLFWPDQRLPKIDRTVSLYQKIDVVNLPPDPMLDQLVKVYSSKLNEYQNYPKDLGLFMDGYFQFWAGFEELYHEYLAHVPVILMNHQPKNVLILGAGDGLLLRELIKYKSVESVTLVDIDPKIIELAKGNKDFAAMNQHSFSDPRVHAVVGDAFQFVRQTHQTFDCIYMDFPDPKDYNLSKIYSREFYIFMKRVLTPDGFAVLDAPRQRKLSSYTALDEDEEIYLQTLLSAGFHHVYRFHSRLETDNPQAHDIFAENIGEANELVVREFDRGAERVKTIYGKEAIVDQMVNDFVSDYQESFYFVTNNDAPLNKQFKDYGLKLYLLNEKRFNLAADSIQGLATKDDSRINSIMRPTLPQLSQWWNIKLPY
jgi:spermidine synthase